jgi:hypothetical protein
MVQAQLDLSQRKLLPLLQPQHPLLWMSCQVAAAQRLQMQAQSQRRSSHHSRRLLLFLLHLLLLLLLHPPQWRRTSPMRHALETPQPRLLLLLL